MRPRTHLKVIRLLLVASVVVMAALALLVAWLIQSAVMSPLFPSPTPPFPQALQTLTSADGQFRCVIRRVPVAAGGLYKLVVSLEDQDGALPGPPAVLPDQPLRKLPVLAWDDRVVMAQYRQETAARQVGWITNRLTAGTTPILTQVWAW